jgi:hypothetical protein
MRLRNNDGTPWSWWIGVPRLLLLAGGSLLGFRFAFDLSWSGAAIAVGVAFGLAGTLWGTFAWMNATGRQLPIPQRLLLRVARRQGAADDPNVER